MTIGERIELRRKQRGFSRQELADRLLIDAKQVWRYETGKNSPTAEVLRAISIALDTTSDWLIGLAEDVNPHYDNSDLDTKERELLKIYRAKPNDKQDSIIAMARVI